MYAVTGTITNTTADEWMTTRQVPTFYLDEAVQGIVSAEHAERIARSIIDPFGVFDVHVGALQVDPPASPLPRVHTWANGFGVWHARVPRHAVAPLVAARRALRDELLARENNVRPEIWLRPERVEDLDNEDTIVYRENTRDPVDERTTSAIVGQASEVSHATHVRHLLEDWIGASLDSIDNSPRIDGDYANFIDEAKERAAALGIPWSDDFIPRAWRGDIRRSAAKKGTLNAGH